MKIIVTGATGLVGSSLVPSLIAGGHAVTRLVRGSAKGVAGVSDVRWDPEKGTVDAAKLEGHDAAVHLAGENVAERWTEEKKRRIRESRVRGTRLIAETLAALAARPKALVCASAIGFYGSERGAEVLTED
ncbi:MAG: NAD-dependent epimerase/dehydratase family protein, partial [Pyrinomonadaceae bacterium]